MNYEEFKKYVDEMNKGIVDKLKDSEEELTFYIELVKRFNDICEENEELKKQLEEIDRKLFFVKNELDMRQKSIDNKLNQQQEFIKYLEDEKWLYEMNTQGYSMNLIENVLAKYKKIIGGKSEL